MDAVPALVLGLLGLLCFIVALVIWSIKLLADHLVHEAFCTCPSCHERSVRTQAQYQKWRRQQAEIRRSSGETDST